MESREISGSKRDDRCEIVYLGRRTYRTVHEEEEESHVRETKN